MAGTTVSGMTFGLSAATPAGLTSSSTNAEKVTAYELLTYTSSATCIITQLPKFKTFWDTGEDEPTVCNDDDEIVDKFQTVQRMEDSSMSFIFVKDDPLIALFNSIAGVKNSVATIQVIHSNGTDKVWAQVLVNSTDEDPTDALGKVKFMVDLTFKKRAVRN